MSEDVLRLETARLIVRSWRETDRDNFAALLADEEVMADQGGPVSRRQADDKFDRYVEAFVTFGYGRLAVERRVESGEAEFLGYVGVMRCGGSTRLATTTRWDGGSTRGPGVTDMRPRRHGRHWTMPSGEQD